MLGCDSRASRKPEAPSSKFGIRVEGVDDVPLRLAKCCRPVSGDPILGYVSLGRGITIHREDCKNVEALMKDPERFTDARLILLWGTNTLTANVHLWPHILEARAKGARIVSIDPRRTRTADQSDEHIALLPGTDAALEDGTDHGHIFPVTCGVATTRLGAGTLPCLMESTMSFSAAQAGGAPGGGAWWATARARVAAERRCPGAGTSA